MKLNNYNIKVDYNGDDKYNNATGSIVLIVASSKPDIVINTSCFKSGVWK